MARTVCVVDDDELVRAKIALDLRGMGYEVIEVEDSRAVPSVLRAQPVDALLVDIVMPERDGVEVIADVRRGWPDVRIIAMSAGGRVGPALYLEIARQMGANVCLAKPLEPDRLKAALA